jgi:hypothetical protein
MQPFCCACVRATSLCNRPRPRRRRRPRKVGRVLFDQAASRRSQVRIGTQTTRSIEDEDGARILLALAPPSSAPLTISKKNG